MSLTAARVVAVQRPFVEALVRRLHEEYGDDPGDIRRQVATVLAGFDGAPVRAFVPILVEKQVREQFRSRQRRPAPQAC